MYKLLAFRTSINGLISINSTPWLFRRMSAQAKCRLVCPTGTHQPVDLPHKEPVIIGRSVLMRIADKKVSRQQLSLVADCQKKSVTVTQLGGNPSQIGEEQLSKGSSSTLTHNTILYIVAGSHPNRVEFTQVEEAQPKRSIGDFFNKKPTSHSSSKRRVESDTDQSESKRQKTEALVDAANGSEGDEEDEEHLRKVQERLSKMKKAYDKVPAPVVENKRSAQRDVPEMQGDPCTAPKWDKHDRLIMYTGAGVRASSKVAGFDIDGCIITTKSGKVFAQNTSDWKIQFPEVKKKLKNLISDGYKVAFFTNQMGITRGKVKEPDLKQKIDAILSELNLPIQVFIASGPGIFRKPCLGMWNFLVNQKIHCSLAPEVTAGDLRLSCVCCRQLLLSAQGTTINLHTNLRNDGIDVDIAKSLYVGDAAGRPEKWAPGKKKDFASSDRLFAINAGLTFHTPEEYFLGYKKAAFNMPEFDPRTLSKDTAMFAQDSTRLTLGEQEVIVNVGLPGSGKSHFVRTHLLPKGYVHVNRDTLGTWQKCVEATKRALKEGRSVVVDNTNVDPDSRKRYVDVAKAARVPCRCFWFDISHKHCRHNERFREMTDKSHQAINDMIFHQHKAKFKPPEKSEGFTEVARVNFTPKFKDQTEETLYRQFLIEK